MKLTTEARLAEEFGLDREKVAELRRRHHWPCVRLGRFDIRYTDAQIEQIVAMHSEAPKKAAAAEAVRVAGQTSRSAARRRSA